MQESKILSIIIPTYNMERYLAYCLDSLLITEHFNKLEVLVVNDGSKDASSAIAHQYASKYPQVFRVIDKENGNYGSCVNVGLSVATGKYVKVVDADDSVNTSHFDHFLAFLQTVDADLVLSDFAVVDTKRTVRKVISYDLGEDTTFKMEDVCGTHAFCNMQMHAVTYQRDILLSINYKQTEGISYTDQEWIFLPMIAVKTVAHYGEYVYCYQVGRVGQTVSADVQRKSMMHVSHCSLDMVEGYEANFHTVKDTPMLAYLNARLIPWVKNIYIFMLTHYGQQERKLLREYDEALKTKSEAIYKLIGSREVSSFMSFEYINYWRQHPTLCPLLVKLLSKAFLILLNLRTRSKEKDAMAVPTSF